MSGGGGVGPALGTRPPGGRGGRHERPRHGGEGESRVRRRLLGRGRRRFASTRSGRSSSDAPADELLQFRMDHLFRDPAPAREPGPAPSTRSPGTRRSRRPAIYTTAIGAEARELAVPSVWPGSHPRPAKIAKTPSRVVQPPAALRVDRNRPPAEAGATNYRKTEHTALPRDSHKAVSEILGTVQPWIPASDVVVPWVVLGHSPS